MTNEAIITKRLNRLVEINYKLIKDFISNQNSHNKMYSNDFSTK